MEINQPLYLLLVDALFPLLLLVDVCVRACLRCCPACSPVRKTNSGPTDDEILTNLGGRGSFRGSKPCTGFATVGTARSDVAKIWYCDSGSDGAGNPGGEALPRVLMINGLGRPAHDFTPFIEQTLDRLRVVAYDPRLVGLSSRHSARFLGHVTARSLAADALDLLHSLGWNDGHGVHVIGYSLGGMVAQEFSLLAPKGLVRSLSLGSTFAGGGLLQILPPFVFQFPSFIAKLRAASQMHREDFVEQTAQSSSVLVGGKQSPADWEHVVEAYRKRTMLYGCEMGGVQAPPSTLLRHLWAAARHYMSPARLARLKALPYPKRVFGTSNHDMLVGIGNSAPLAAAIGASLKTYPGAGHDIWVHGQRRAVIADLELFITQAAELDQSTHRCKGA